MTTYLSKVIKIFNGEELLRMIQGNRPAFFGESRYEGSTELKEAAFNGLQHETAFNFDICLATVTTGAVLFMSLCLWREF
jgi:hypothetical protein